MSFGDWLIILFLLILWGSIGVLLLSGYAFLTGIVYIQIAGLLPPLLAPLLAPFLLIILIIAYFWPHEDYEYILRTATSQKRFDMPKNKKLFVAIITSLVLPVLINAINEVLIFFNYQIIPIVFKNRFYLIIITIIVAYPTLITTPLVSLTNFFVGIPRKIISKLGNKGGDVFKKS